MSIQKEFFACANNRNFVRQALWKTVQENVERCRKALIPVLVTGIQSARAGGTRRVFSAQRLGLAGFL
jgi:hypothetical protein